jgi:D-alanyl-D-alanine-carboxypeptidase/D-alanyl-D-alanine-endopeptidase
MLEPVPNGDMPAFEGSGALRSTANDLLTFLGAALGDGTSPLAHAMAAMLQVRRPTGNPSLKAAIGWDVLTLSPGYEFVFKDGATVGYRSFIAYDARARTGVVVLSNAASTGGVADIAIAPP